MVFSDLPRAPAPLCDHGLLDFRLKRGNDKSSGTLLRGTIVNRTYGI